MKTDHELMEAAKKALISHWAKYLCVPDFPMTVDFDGGKITVQADGSCAYVPNQPIEYVVTTLRFSLPE